MMPLANMPVVRVSLQVEGAERARCNFTERARCKEKSRWRRQEVN